MATAYSPRTSAILRECPGWWCANPPGKQSAGSRGADRRRRFVARHEPAGERRPAGVRGEAAGVGGGRRKGQAEFAAEEAGGGGEGGAGAQAGADGVGGREQLEGEEVGAPLGRGDLGALGRS